MLDHSQGLPTNLPNATVEQYELYSGEKTTNKAGNQTMYKSNDNISNGRKSSNIFSDQDDDDDGIDFDSTDTLDFKLGVIKSAGILRGLVPSGADMSRYADPKANQNIKGGRQLAKQVIGKSKDKPQAFWKVFEAVYHDVRFNSWKQLYLQGKTVVNYDTLMCRFEDVVCSRKGSEAFLKSRRRDFETRKGFNPVKELLEGYAKKYPEPFDGWDSLAETLFGTKEILHQEMITRWLMGAVARAVVPGEQVDTMLVLKSKQGAAKTTFFRALGGEYFFQVEDIQSIETVRNMQKGWIGECGELESITKREVEPLKHFLSKTEDALRVMHTEDIPERPRHVVFGGTCNSDEILKDTTGNRRFMIVPVIQNIPIAWLKEHREHILATAYHKYQEHEQNDTPWWFTNELEALAEVQNADYTEKSQYDDSITMLLEEIERLWVNRHGTDIKGVVFTLPDFMESGLSIPKANHKLGRQDAKIAKALESHGYVKKKQRVMGMEKPITGWSMPGIDKEHLRYLKCSDILGAKTNL